MDNIEKLYNDLLDDIKKTFPGYWDMTGDACSTSWYVDPEKMSFYTTQGSGKPEMAWAGHDICVFSFREKEYRDLPLECRDEEYRETELNVTIPEQLRGNFNQIDFN